MSEVVIAAGERLQGKTAMVFGGGQTPGTTVGNGRATALTFARQGAEVAIVDRILAAAQDTVDEIVRAGGRAFAIEADVLFEDQIVAAVGMARSRWERIDILHNNVGASLAAGDAPLTEVTPEAFDRVMALNLRGMVMTCKHVVPIMREQRSGVVLNVSSLATLIDYRNIAYKTSKAGVNALTTTLAISNAEYGIRANALLPGLINTPMAIESRVAAGHTRDEVIAERDVQVPLGGRMGSAWDVAAAALFLVSDEARFITGVLLPVDGGQSLKVG